MSASSEHLLDRAVAVRSGEDLDLPALDAYLGKALPSLCGALSVEQFPSGFSNLTYLLNKGGQELVLRRPPFGAQVKSGHDMRREHTVLSALAGPYPHAPKPLALCTDHEVLGCDFYVMEKRSGLIVRDALPNSLRGDPALFGSMCNAVVDALAELHAVDLAATGLDQLDRGPAYVQRQVEGWLRRLERAKTSPLPDFDAVGAWLGEHMREDLAHTLIHNDYKFDNVMLDPADPTRIVAVLDWEMCTVGDPLMDLGTTLGYWTEPGDDPAWQALGLSPTASAGGLTRVQTAQRYAEKTGRDVSEILFYYAFGLLKIGVIVQQIFFRFARGHTQDPRFAKLDRVVAALGRMATKAIARGSI